MGITRIVNVSFPKCVHQSIPCRRAGGGFGGKANRCQPAAVAASLAARATGSAVKLALDRNTDMATVGGRCETMVTYDVAFDDTGKVLALDITAYLQGGAFMVCFVVKALRFNRVSLSSLAGHGVSRHDGDGYGH